MNQITPQFILSCLQSYNDYKNTKILKQTVIANKIEYFKPICTQITQILLNDQYTPMRKLLAVRLSKDLIDLINPHFVETFGIHTLKSFKIYAEYNMESDEPYRGFTFFSQQPTEEEKLIGNSIVQLVLDCIRAWAMFFPLTQDNKNTVFLDFYQQLLHKGAHFPPQVYYKDNFIQQHKKDQFDQIMDIQQQPIQIFHTDTPIPEEIVNKEKPVDIAQKAILHSNQIKDKVGQICAQTGTQNYCMHIFDDVQIQSEQFNSQMENIINNLIEVNEENLIIDILDEVVSQQKLISEIDHLNNNSNHYPLFRKKHIGNYPDLAYKEEFIQQLQKQQQIIFENKLQQLDLNHQVFAKKQKEYIEQLEQIVELALQQYPNFGEQIQQSNYSTELQNFIKNKNIVQSNKPLQDIKQKNEKN